MILNLLLTLMAAVATQATGSAAAPETFTATAQAKGATASVTATVEIHIRRYTPEFDRTAVEDGFETRRLQRVSEGAAKSASRRSRDARPAGDAYPLGQRTENGHRAA